MEQKIFHVTEFKSQNSTYSRTIRTDLLSKGVEDLTWKKESETEMLVLDEVRYLSPQDWSCLIDQLNPLIEYNQTVSDPEDRVSIEGGLVTVFDVFPKDYRHSNGNFLPGGVFFYRHKTGRDKYTYGYSGVIWRVGNPNIPKSYIELKPKDYKSTNTVKLGRFKEPAPQQTGIAASTPAPAAPQESSAGYHNSQLANAYAQLGIKLK